MNNIQETEEQTIERLRAENERLRAECAHRAEGIAAAERKRAEHYRNWRTACSSRDTAESLLKEASSNEASTRSALEASERLRSAAESRLTTAIALIQYSSDGDGAFANYQEYSRAREAFLANQPAAPLACPDCGGPLTPGVLLPDTLRCERCARPVAPRCPEHEVPLVNHFFRCGCRYVQPAAICSQCGTPRPAAGVCMTCQPAAPARDEDIGEHPSEPSYAALRGQVEYWREQATRTESDQAVLDAANLRDLGYDEWCEAVYKAELARRGLKP